MVDSPASNSRELWDAAGDAVSAWAIPTNEELMIARHTCAVCGIDLEGNSGELKNVATEEIHL